MLALEFFVLYEAHDFFMTLEGKLTRNILNSPTRCRIDSV